MYHYIITKIMPIIFVLIKRIKSSFAKNIAILIVLALFFSCSKNEIKISLADQMSGDYIAKSINIGGTLIPMPFISGKTILDIKFVVTKKMDKEVSLVVELKETLDGKDKLSRENYDKLTLKENVDGSISLLLPEGKEIAKVSNQTIKAKYDFNGIETTIEGVKK